MKYVNYVTYLILFFIYTAILSIGLVDLCFQTCVFGDIVHASVWKPVEINWILFDTTMALGGVAGIWSSISGLYQFVKNIEN